LQRLRLIPRRAHPDVTFFVRRQDHRHGFRMIGATTAFGAVRADQRSSQDLCEREPKIIRNQSRHSSLQEKLKLVLSHNDNASDAKIENKAGKPEGRDEEFWHAAEQELRNADKSSPVRTPDNL